MQNSTLKVDQIKVSKTSNFFSRLKAAYALMRAKQAVLLIENNITAFNLSPQQVESKCMAISFGIFAYLDNAQQKDKIDEIINNLIQA